MKLATLGNIEKKGMKEVVVWQRWGLEIAFAKLFRRNSILY
jgi:hypothetical protein